MDRRVIDYPWLARNLLVRGIIAPFRSGPSAKAYKEVWTEDGSPLLIYGERLEAGVKEILAKNDLKVDCNRTMFLCSDSMVKLVLDV